MESPGRRNIAQRAKSTGTSVDTTAHARLMQGLKRNGLTKPGRFVLPLCLLLDLDHGTLTPLVIDDLTLLIVD
jgi:hypothetical protein